MCQRQSIYCMGQNCFITTTKVWHANKVPFKCHNKQNSVNGASNQRKPGLGWKSCLVCYSAIFWATKKATWMQSQIPLHGPSPGKTSLTSPIHSITVQPWYRGREACKPPTPGTTSLHTLVFRRGTRRLGLSTLLLLSLHTHTCAPAFAATCLPSLVALPLQRGHRTYCVVRWMDRISWTGCVCAAPQLWWGCWTSRVVRERRKAHFRQNKSLLNLLPDCL